MYVQNIYLLLTCNHFQAEMPQWKSSGGQAKRKYAKLILN